MKKILIILSAIVVVFIVFFDGFFVLKDGSDVKIKESLTTKNGSSVIYVVNLKKDTEKYNYTKKLINKTLGNFERIDALYGKDLDKDYVKKISDSNTYYKYMGLKIGNGTIGCYMSHLRAWEMFLQSDKEFAIIFEDDIEFRDEYKKNLNQIIQKALSLKSSWDILLLERGHGDLTLPLQKINNELSIKQYITHVSHTAGYIINRHAAKELIKKALPIKMPVDHFFRRTWEMNNVRFAGIEPAIAYQREIESSRTAIEGNSNRRGFNLQRSVYVVKTSIIEFLFNVFSWVTYKK